jgi:AhpD family alkylhydroperoxidase
MNILEKVSLKAKTIETADPISSKIMSSTQKAIGMIPNMYSLMANNPSLLDAYRHSYDTFRANSGFTPPEQEVVFLSVSYENNCEYCMAAHSFVGDKMTKVPIEVTDAIRNNTEIPDDKLRALSLFTKAMVIKKGNPSKEDIDSFISAGYSTKHILGVITGIGVKTLSNYFNHVFKTPVDDAFKGRIWKKPI